MRCSRLIVVLVTVAAVSPIAGIALWSIHRTTVELTDPCAKWENAPGDQAATIGPDDPCRAVTVHGGSKRQTAIIATLVPGGMFAAAVLAIAGAASSRRRFLLAGAFGMLAETIVAFSMAPLTLIVGLGLLLLARRVQLNS